MSMNSQKKKKSIRSVANSAPTTVPSITNSSAMKPRTRFWMSVHDARMVSGVRKVVSRTSQSEKPSTASA